MNDQQPYSPSSAQQGPTSSPYDRHYSQPPYYPPRKKGIGAGGIIAIILVSVFCLLLLGGAAVAGKMLFDPNSRISLYRFLDRGSSAAADPAAPDNDRQQFETAPNTQSPFDEDNDRSPAMPLLPDQPVESPDIDTSHASESMQEVTIGSHDTLLTTAQVYARLAPSVVGIVVETPNGSGSGSGVVMTSDGYILTNAHVVEDATSVTVTLLDGSEYPVAVVGSDAATDIAVIRVDKTGLQAATFGNSDQIAVGEDAIAIGNPLGLELSFTITKGIISAINRNIVIGGYSMTLIQTDAAINPGNSGGPLINQYGEVIGITSAKIMSSYASGSVEGIGFAIPINAAMDIARDLAAHGHVTGRPYLGIVIQTQYVQVGSRYDYHVVIITVEENSPAAAAGLQVGDVILAVNDVEVFENSDLLAERDKYKPGDTVSLKVLRGDRELTLPLTMTEAQ